MESGTITFIGGTAKTGNSSGDTLLKTNRAPQPTKRSSSEAKPIESNSDMETDSYREEFEAVRSKKKQKIVNNKPTPIVLNNKFDILTDSDGEEDNAPQKTKIIKPPAIVLPIKYKEKIDIQKTIKNIMGDQFTIKYTTKGIHVSTDNEANWEKVTSELKSLNINNFTYAPKSQKTYAYVIRGLDQDPPVEEIKAKLESENFQIKEIFKMKTQFRPLFLVISTSFFKISNLNKIYKYILNTKISWERRRNEKVISQCHRCQAWSHAATYCNMAARCLKCAGKHQTKDCTKPPTVPAKCVNCGQAHPANYTGCEAYKKALDAKMPAEKVQARTFKPAPQPKDNYWTKNQMSLYPPRRVLLPTPISLPPSHHHQEAMNQIGTHKMIVSHYLTSYQNWTKLLILIIFYRP